MRIWVGKFEADALDDDRQTAGLIQEYQAKITALERMVGRQALEIELLKGAFKACTLAEKRELCLGADRDSVGGVIGF